MKPVNDFGIRLKGDNLSGPPHFLLYTSWIWFYMNKKNILKSLWCKQSV